MSKKIKAATIVLLFLALFAAAAVYWHTHSIAVFDPAGTIAAKERNLMVITLLLSVIVVVPVFALTIFIVLKYRESNTKPNKKYSPEWANSRWLELLWWAIPCAIILTLAIITWTSSHALDPFKQINAGKKPLTIQVVAMNWKWLFIYPEQNIATVNYADIPVNTEVDFHITSDAAMNSFWVPQLGGQIYAMAGMDTQLHLSASKTGSYNGLSANISGQGFSGMKFTVQSVSQSDFDQWIDAVRASSSSLSTDTYAKLAMPSQDNPRAAYAPVQTNLYSNIIDKYMSVSNQSTDMHGGMH